ncbi:carbohydrate ABC transporter permease [Cryptosporangium arvum]|uniref:Permease component of ABC-type sugar transporter n=1 Tax=Cryptosporangium arvum DSM 44712 TaxID=927661 RepID=A0A010Z1Z3_9ACTN|nr:sugar ABC transporter permease [Cryptosporangium arvum]EXG81448.1 permease component of ABC-type sugar transporter [Cryptosporangium arvum DSM 44712]
MATTITAPDEAPPDPGSPPRRKRRRTPALPYLLLIPAIVLELAVHVIPMLTGIWMSLKELTQFHIRDWSGAPFIGLDNYKVALDFNSATGKELLHSFWVTALCTILVVGLSYGLGLAAAVLLQRPFRGRALLRTLFLTPYALPVYAGVIIWSFLLQRDTGALNHILVDQLHVVDDRPFWLIGGNSFWSLVIVMVWRHWPFAFLCLMAGLQGIPQDLYEAAYMDGAGFWRRLRAVTLPMLGPVNQVLLLVLFLWTFNDFNTPYVLFGKAAPDQADLISIHIYESSFVTWNFGLGSAMSVALLLFLSVVSGIYLFLTRKARADA